MLPGDCWRLTPEKSGTEVLIFDDPHPVGENLHQKWHRWRLKRSAANGSIARCSQQMSTRIKLILRWDMASNPTSLVSDIRHIDIRYYKIMSLNTVAQYTTTINNHWEPMTMRIQRVVLMNHDEPWWTIKDIKGTAVQLPKNPPHRFCSAFEVPVDALHICLDANGFHQPGVQLQGLGKSPGLEWTNHEDRMSIY